MCWPRVGGKIRCFPYVELSDVPQLQQVHKSRRTAEESWTTPSYVIQWYIESCKMFCTWKKIDVKKKREGQSEAPYRVLSTSTYSVLWSYYWILDISVPGQLGTWTFRYWPGHLGTRYWTVRDMDETIFGTDHNCLALINCQYFCTSSSLIHIWPKRGSIWVFDNSSVDRSRRSLFLYIDFYLYFHCFDLHLLYTKVIMQIMKFSTFVKKALVLSFH